MTEPAILPKPRRGMLGFYVAMGALLALAVGTCFAWTPLRIRWLSYRLNSAEDTEAHRMLFDMLTKEKYAPEVVDAVLRDYDNRSPLRAWSPDQRVLEVISSDSPRQRSASYHQMGGGAIELPAWLRVLQLRWDGKRFMADFRLNKAKNGELGLEDTGPRRLPLSDLTEMADPDSNRLTDARIKALMLKAEVLLVEK